MDVIIQHSTQVLFVTFELMNTAAPGNSRLCVKFLNKSEWLHPSFGHETTLLKFARD